MDEFRTSDLNFIYEPPFRLTKQRASTLRSVLFRPLTTVFSMLFPTVFGDLLKISIFPILFSCFCPYLAFSSYILSFLCDFRVFFVNFENRANVKLDLSYQIARFHIPRSTSLTRFTIFYLNGNGNNINIIACNGIVTFLA